MVFDCCLYKIHWIDKVFQGRNLSVGGLKRQIEKKCCVNQNLNSEYQLNTQGWKWNVINYCWEERVNGIQNLCFAMSFRIYFQTQSEMIIFNLNI